MVAKKYVSKLGGFVEIQPGDPNYSPPSGGGGAAQPAPAGSQAVAAPEVAQPAPPPDKGLLQRMLQTVKEMFTSPDMRQIEQAGGKEAFAEQLAAGEQQPFNEAPSNIDLALAATGARAGAKVIKVGTTTIKNIRSKILKKSINKLASWSGKSVKQIEKILKNKKFDRELTKIENAISIKNKLKPLAKTVIGIWSIQGIIQWGAFDNLITGANILIRDTAEKVQWGRLDPVKAIEDLEKAKELQDLAMDTLRFGAATNPFLYAYKKFWVDGTEMLIATQDTNIDSVRQAAALQKQQQQQQEVSQRDLFWNSASDEQKQELIQAGKFDEQGTLL